MTARPLSVIATEAWTRAKEAFQLTADLAKAQSKKQGTGFGIGAALMVAALATIVVIPPLLVTALILGLIAMGLWPWAACLIVTAVALVACLGLALAGKVMLTRVFKAIGETAAQVKGTINALKGTATTQDQDSP